MKYGQMVAGLWTPLMVKRLALDLKGAHAMTWDGFLDEQVEHGVIGPATGDLLKFYQKRASNRGSSGAMSRFTIKGSWKKMLGKGWTLDGNTENFPLELCIYTEMKASRKGHRAAIAKMASFCEMSYAMDSSEAVGFAKELVTVMKEFGVKADDRQRRAARRGLRGTHLP